METRITTKSIDPDNGLYKFSVVFDHGGWSASHTYYYKTEGEVDAEIAKATPLKDSLTDETMVEQKFENNAIK